MPCSLGAIDTAPGDDDQMRATFHERSVFEEEQNVLLDPELQVAHGKQDALGLAIGRCTPVFAEAGQERRLLLFGWQLEDV